MGKLTEQVLHDENLPANRTAIKSSVSNSLCCSTQIVEQARFRTAGHGGTKQTRMGKATHAKLRRGVCVEKLEPGLLLEVPVAWAPPGNQTSKSECEATAMHRTHTQTY